MSIVDQEVFLVSLLFVKKYSYVCVSMFIIHNMSASPVAIDKIWPFYTLLALIFTSRTCLYIMLILSCMSYDVCMLKQLVFTGTVNERACRNGKYKIMCIHLSYF